MSLTEPGFKGGNCGEGRNGLILFGSTAHMREEGRREGRKEWKEGRGEVNNGRKEVSKEGGRKDRWKAVIKMRDKKHEIIKRAKRKNEINDK